MGRRSEGGGESDWKCGAGRSSGRIMAHRYVYNWRKSYDWNFEHAPEGGCSDAASTPGPVDADAGSRGPQYTFCGLPVTSPLGIAAGPLLNGKWISWYARLGYSSLTYKTVRSRRWECYPPPNLQPISQGEVRDGQTVTARASMGDSWAISFGMPSREPQWWRSDMQWARQQLRPGQVLVASVVASPQPEWTLEEIGADYARCARWAADAGADCVELNLSCPNVSSADGRLYCKPESAARVARQVRELVPEIPLVLKIGYVGRAGEAQRLVDAVAGCCNALSMVNCLSCRVKGPDGYLFGGEQRGIGGAAIRRECLRQVERFASAIQRSNVPLSIIGVGGISRPEHVQTYLDAGAEATQVATAAVLCPQLAAEWADWVTGRVRD